MNLHFSWWLIEKTFPSPLYILIAEMEICPLFILIFKIF